MSSYLTAFSRQIRSTTGTLRVWIWKIIPMSFPFSAGMTLPTALVMPIEAPQPSHHSCPEVQGLLDSSDSMDYGEKSLHDVKVVMGNLGQRGKAAGDARGIVNKP